MYELRYTDFSPNALVSLMNDLLKCSKNTS